MADTIAQAIVRSAMERGSFGDHLMSSLLSALGNLAGGVLGDAARSVFKEGKLDYADDILSDPTTVQSTVVARCYKGAYSSFIYTTVNYVTNRRVSQSLYSPKLVRRMSRAFVRMESSN
jgi:hypothetical protein